jgi:hypothetical protein
VFNDETQYKIYKRRLKDLPNSELDEQRQKEKFKDDFYRDGNNLTYGQATGVSVDGVNRMVDGLKSTAERRNKFSRRRGQFDEDDVTSINERNRKFNQKIARAFDPYTTTVKQNLERGTAV